MRAASCNCRAVMCWLCVWVLHSPSWLIHKRHVCVCVCVCVCVLRSQAFQKAAAGHVRTSAGMIIGSAELAQSIGAAMGDIIVMKTTQDEAFKKT